MGINSNGCFPGRRFIFFLRNGWICDVCPIFHVCQRCGIIQLTANHLKRDLKFQGSTLQKIPERADKQPSIHINPVFCWFIGQQNKEPAIYLEPNGAFPGIAEKIGGDVHCFSLRPSFKLTKSSKKKLHWKMTPVAIILLVTFLGWWKLDPFRGENVTSNQGVKRSRGWITWPPEFSNHISASTPSGPKDGCEVFPKGTPFSMRPLVPSTPRRLGILATKKTT